MRSPRFKAPESFPFAHYHVLSRIVNREYVMGPEEREQFRKLMREYEGFCRVKVLTYCLLSNHFHILLEVPRPPPEGLSDAGLLEQLAALPDSVWARQVRDRFQRFLENGQVEAAQEEKRQVCRLMWDLSSYVKLLKQRFTQWYNRRNGRKGTLWEERFRSVLVEALETVLPTISAYIDLNPVRAGVVKDPKDYRWSGYGEAMGGGKVAKEGIERIMREKGLEGYRRWIYCSGVMDEGVTEEGKPIRLGFTLEEVQAVMAAKGKLPIAEYLRLRVRYFAEGRVLGTQAFAEGLWKAYRERHGLVRKLVGVHPMAGVDAPLFTFKGPQCAPSC